MTDALPDGSILLHIGPHKTGTTTIQHALAGCREELRGQGVVYAGRVVHEMTPALAVATGRVGPGRDVGNARRRWEGLLAEIAEARPRIGVLSSEFYSQADEPTIAALLARIGPGTQVVVTLRPLVRIIGSQWQQYVQNKQRAAYDTWLHDVLDEPGAGSLTPTFWQRHRHDALVRRWADAAGADRVRVVVVDDRRHDALLRDLEALLGVRPGTLDGDPDARARNRSLTWEEVEMVRAFNLLRPRERWDRADYERLVRFGAARALQARAPDPADHRLVTPDWAVRRAGEIGAEMVRGIEATGVRVLGDLSLLASPDLAPATGDNPVPTGVGPGAAAAFASGLLDRMGTSTGPAKQAREAEEGVSASGRASRRRPWRGPSARWGRS